MTLSFILNSTKSNTISNPSTSNVTPENNSRDDTYYNLPKLSPAETPLKHTNSLPSISSLSVWNVGPTTPQYSSLSDSSRCLEDSLQMTSLSNPPTPITTSSHYTSILSRDSIGDINQNGSTLAGDAFNYQHCIDSTKSMRGLRYFSKVVCEKVQRKGITTYNEVADDLVRELSEQVQVSGESVDHKNIRRRIYDALNVLMAIDIIKKENKQIKWVGMPSNSYGNEVKMLERDNFNLRNEIKKEESVLEEKINRLVKLEALVRRNKSRQPSHMKRKRDQDYSNFKKEKKHLLPFMLLCSQANSKVAFKTNQSRHYCEVTFHGRSFEIVEDFQVLDYLFKDLPEKDVLEVMLPFQPKFCKNHWKAAKEGS